MLDYFNREIYLKLIFKKQLSITKLLLKKVIQMQCIEGVYFIKKKIIRNMFNYGKRLPI